MSRGDPSAYNPFVKAGSLPTPVCPRTIPCKCCGNPASLCGVVDFNKHCRIDRPDILPVIGIPIYYHRCGECGFIFSIAFDHFTRQDFLDHIYNELYPSLDPDYAELRPRNHANWIAGRLGAHRSTRILDYGGGNGKLAAILRQAGFADATTYDPFVTEFSARPGRRFDCVLCFEVGEHACQPAEVFDDIFSLLNPNGIVVFSTLLQPADIENQGLNWWYVGPRNGHISLFTAPHWFQSSSRADSCLARLIPICTLHGSKFPTSRGRSSNCRHQPVNPEFSISHPRHPCNPR